MEYKMFEIVKTAGLLPHEVAKLVKVSRVTASMWVNGHNKPHKLLTKKVEKFLDAVRSAVESGDLPVSTDLNREERSRAIVAALVKQLQNTETKDSATVEG